MAEGKSKSKSMIVWLVIALLVIVIAVVALLSRKSDDKNGPKEDPTVNEGASEEGTLTVIVDGREFTISFGEKPVVTDNKAALPVPPCQLCTKELEKNYGKGCKRAPEDVNICTPLVNTTLEQIDTIMIIASHGSPTCQTYNINGYFFVLPPGCKVPSPLTSMITASPTSIPADGTSSATITFLLKDAAGYDLTSDPGTDVVVPSTDLGTVNPISYVSPGVYTATLTSNVAGTATISGSVNGAAIVDTATITAQALGAAIEFSSAMASDTETNGGNLPVLLINGALANPETINVNVGGGSALIDTDFTSNALVNIAPGSYDGTSATAVPINVTILDDTSTESDETIDLALASPSAGLTIGDANSDMATQQTHMYTIMDDDMPQVSIAPSITPGAEPATNGQFTVTQSAPTASDTVVSYSVAGTATEGVDYNNIGTSTTIPANSTTATIDVLVQDDSDVEGVETVVVTLTGTNSASVIVAPTPSNAATVGINDDD